MRLNNKGFTLVEVLAVIVILSVLGGIAVMGGLSSINNSKDASYRIMVSNIVTASNTLYEEISNSYFTGSKIYHYTTECTNNLECNTGNELSINDGKISTNLQTLVSNGFLVGINNECSSSCENYNTKILLDPKSKKDIGSCEIEISKSGIINKSTDSKCPSEYKKEVRE